MLDARPEHHEAEHMVAKRLCKFFKAVTRVVNGPDETCLPYDIEMLCDHGMDLIEVKSRSTYSNGDLPWPVWAEVAKVDRLSIYADRMGGRSWFAWIAAPPHEDGRIYLARLDHIRQCPINAHAGRYDRNRYMDFDPCYEVPETHCLRVP